MLGLCEVFEWKIKRINDADLFSKLPLLICNKGANISGGHCIYKITKWCAGLAEGLDSLHTCRYIKCLSRSVTLLTVCFRCHLSNKLQPVLQEAQVWCELHGEERLEPGEGRAQDLQAAELKGPCVWAADWALPGESCPLHQPFSIIAFHLTSSTHSIPWTTCMQTWAVFTLGSFPW